MAGQTRFTVDGGKEIEKLLLELPVRYQKRALQRAFEEGAKVVLEEARSQARSHGIGGGGFIDSIVIAKPQRDQGLGKDTVVVIALKKTHSALAHLFEFDTKERFRNSDSARGKKGNHQGGFTGRMIASPFLRPAMDIKGKEAVEIIARVTKENIETIVGQLARGQKVSLRRKR